MCGIAGIVTRRGEPPDRVLLERMAESLRHRGPDDSGIEISGPVGFAFRRLAILDLSPAGHQPMVNEDGSCCVMFNGEIYNYVELREELEKLGYIFRSRSDTEVILHLYTRQGTNALNRLNGMFAIAIHDRNNNRVILARDRMGKKPLFYWQGPFGLAFASELRALRLLPGFPADLDPEALGLFVMLGWIPNSHCIYPGVRKLPPSSWAEYDCATGRLSEPRRYWDLPPPGFDTTLTEEEWLDRIETLLSDATRIRLRSDVPLGVFLSGGVDSGLVAACAAKAQQDLTALTIGFDEEEYDETELARRTAQHLGCRHIVRKLRLRDACDLLPQVMGHFDEPFADSSALPTFLVCEQARKEFTVVLSGDGGDEVFAGYFNHLRAHRFRLLNAVPASFRRVLAEALAPFGVEDSRWRRAMHRFGQHVATFGLGAIMFPFQDWPETLVDPQFLLSPDRTIQLSTMSVELNGDFDPLDEAQRFDLRFFMLNDILVKVDRMSMRHALEVRCPLLDHRIVELGLFIPPRFRVKNGKNKYMLRQLAKRVIPERVASAPKRGFGIPLHDWLFSDNSGFFKDALLGSCRRFNDLFKPGAAEKLYAAAANNRALDSAVFQALAFKWWCHAQA